DHWIEAVGGIIQPASLFRIDIWQGGQDRPIVYNVLKFNSEPPPQDVFDVGQCFVASQKYRLLVYFAVVNNGSLDTVSYSYLKETLHSRLVTAAFLPPLRLSKLSIEFVGISDVYVDAMLLENSPLTNPRIVPPPRQQHTMEAAYEFLKGQIGGRLRITLSSTTHQKTVILESRGILKIDYSQEFAAITTTSTTSTTEATPPLPDIPTTAKPLVPTKYNTPDTLPTQTPCTCPTPKCATPSSSPCPTLPSSTQTQCPKITCPPSTCPTVNNRGCPIKTCPTPQPCASCPTPSPCPKPTVPSACPTPAPSLCMNKTCPVTTPCPKVTCPKLTCPILSCPPTKPCISVPCTTNCPTPPTTTPCPNIEGHLGHQQSQQSDSDSGVKGGAVAGIAIVMVIVGIVIGFAAIILYKKFRVVSPDKRNIIDRYLDDEERY
ncbi:uncharacterized protein LOC132730416, partial [Ruditapes philippinarum]|uniref:uncharacterized protein LOC132730416 n=1 Tax=Ruditapes philippinarum TaxID=129788 RepID=UPI00295BAC1D